MFRKTIFAIAAIATISAAALVSTEASAKGFKYGVSAGDTSSSSAIVWTRSDKAGRVTLQVSRDKRFRRGVKRYKLRTRRSHSSLQGDANVAKY